MKFYLAHEEHMLPEYADNVLVKVRANNPGIQHYQPGNCPEPNSTMASWLRANCKDDVYFSHYEPVEEATSGTVQYFEVHIWFADKSQALMFKLAWGGQ